MQRIQVRTLEEVDGPPLADLLALLPPATGPVLLGAAGGQGAEVRGWSLLAWCPDRRHAGRIEPAAEAPPAQRPWPRARCRAFEAWQAECGRERWARDDVELPALGGWIGLLGFELGHLHEHWPWTPRGDFPDIHQARYRGFVLRGPDQRLRLCWAELDGSPAAVQREERSSLLRRFRAILSSARASSEGGSQQQAVELRPVWSAARYADAVRRIRAWIAAGELYQANLCHALEGRFAGDPRALHATVAARQPTAYGSYWEDGAGGALLSWSPECYLRVRGDRLTTRPIKGTVARHADPELDRAAVRRLEQSVKERAELTMIVDMARHDLGRLAPAGSVRVPSAGAVQSLPTLHHRVAEVTARWDPAHGLGALLAATFPPASVSGAPKLRALRAIAELEERARGPYCGAFGWWMPGEEPQGEWAVLIRCALALGGKLRVGVGAGIVWDSDPGAEWEETLLKARFLAAGGAGRTAAAGALAAGSGAGG